MRELKLQKAPTNTPKVFGCGACFDYGIVLLVEREIVGITDLMENSMPCTCPAGDRRKVEYAA